MARRTASSAIFDLSTMGMDELRACLQKIDPAGPVRDIKISSPAFFEPSLGPLLKETGVRNIWVECHPQTLQGAPSAFVRRLRELSETHGCFPIFGDLDLLSVMLKDRLGIGRIVLKGCEASGFVSAETTLVLYSAVKAMLRTSSRPIDILIWGGVFTPEAAAAFLSTGAAGIVFESLHWLTDLVAMDDLQRQRLSNLRIDATDLLGLNLRVPCRLFNKGNSLAFKELKTFVGSLCAAEVTEESRRAFVAQVHAMARPPLESHFTQREVIPLGVEAAFARSFVERFGAGTEAAVKAFMDETRNACHRAGAQKDCFLDSPVAREMGIQYPFIQGAMSWITDVPEFAAGVADAGGLPTIALGSMDAQALDRRLGRLPEIMRGRPYAVNVVTLAENPFRETHLAWIKRHRPRFVTIAGGDLSPLPELIESGLEVIYIAPDEALLKLALEAGVRYLICEGYEAGGHVGQHSTLTLAQMVLDLKRRQPALFRNCRLILAGGIFNRETAFMAAMLGADAIQMGTAYLATREIAATQALTTLYQRMILKSPPGGTVVSGQETGLRVRSLRSPRVEAILSLERAFAAGRQDETAFRTSMEKMAAQSLFAAARGLDRPDGAALEEPDCLELGQFMSGACAGLIGKVQTLAAFHQELAQGPLGLHPLAPAANTTSSPVPGQGATRVAPHGEARERVVITGMSQLNTLGKSPEEVWAASLAMQSGITLVPPARWDHALFYHPKPQLADKTYCQVGAFLDFDISRDGLGIPPHDFRTMTTATKITMWLADKAIQASGLLASDIPRERIAVLISQNSGEAAGTLTNMIIRGYVHDILASINQAVQLTPEQQRAIEQAVKSGRMAPDDTTLLGRLNCAAPGFICNRYGFMGPSYSVSAACATSLVALHSAIQLIRGGIVDAVIVGGGEDTLTHMHFLEFSALGALYGLSGKQRPAHESSRPFDAERDGMVLGEGGAMIVIERESLARARGARIHAVITGMGASNNHLGMVEPASATQEMAIRASFRGLPYGPAAVDLVECHATSTRQGDVEEVRALGAVFDASHRTMLTSFKSQIGHTLGASGLNSLIRGVMAMQAGVFPPTLNYTHPDPEIDRVGSGFVIPSEPLDWQRTAGAPRRLEVNAFGFGGSNFVVQVEQAMDEVGTILVSPDRQPAAREEQRRDLSTPQGLAFLRTEMDGLNCRMAVVGRPVEAALTVIQNTAGAAQAQSVAPKARKLAHQGIFIQAENLPVPPLAFVFPGQGAQYGGMGRELYASFPVIREWMDRAAAAADFDLLQLMFHDREENLQKTRWQQPATFAMENAMARYLTTLGIRPVAMAGHSLGELTALCQAGVYSPEDGFRIVNKRAICMDKAAAANVDPGVMAAVDAPLDLLQEMIRGRDDIHIGNINSPNQVVLSGGTEAVQDLGKRLKAKGHRATLLRVSMAFHSPIMKVIHEELEAYIAAIAFHPPRIPVISNTTLRPYPSDPDEIKKILMAHLESTVHWMDNVRTLSNDYGVRLFVEVGPGDILSNLIADTLPEAACIQTCLSGAEALTCKSALAQLFVQGHLKVEGQPRFVSLPALGKTPEGRKQAPPAPVPAETPADPDLMERLIRIIMEATGFNRDEIQPDMDLRRDLSIRSSRLPIIMDAAERHFGIEIELEDFLDVHTVKDIAQRIAKITARQEGAGLRPAAKAVDPDPPRDRNLNASEDEARLKRLVFDHTPVASAASIPLALSPGASVLLLSPDRDDRMAQRAGDILRMDYGVDTLPMACMQAGGRPGQEGHDIRTDAGALRAADKIAGLPLLSGMVITLGPDSPAGSTSMADVARLLRGFFLLLKRFLQSPSKKFVVLIHSGEDSETPGRLLAEGMLGLFLSAAQEYPSVQFHTLDIDGNTDLRTTLRAALDRGCPVVEIIHRDDKVITSEGQLAPSVFGGSAGLHLHPGDVVVMSGGATGISAELARCLVPYAPCLVFLGRTPLAPGFDPATPLPENASSEAFASDPKAVEIARTLADLHASGIEASYHTCDVTDPEAVRAVMGAVAARYGKIDGIVHGAGILRDGFLSHMTPDDFSMVMDVKFLGAWNLFSSAEKAGLKFFVGLSSVAAIQGNPGQANYAAANRTMSALLRALHRKNSAIRFKALMLPPVEGTGMAEDPELRALLKQKGVGYIHVNELAGLFCRELFVAPPDDDWVLFMRRLPSIKTALLNDRTLPSSNGNLDGGIVSFSPADFPMIDKVSSLDIRREELEAFRSFSPEKDLWILDHKPFKFIKHPIVSAAMVLETFMEAARILYPHQQVRGVRKVRLMEMIQCPPGVPRPSRISCRRSGNGLREVLCETSLAAQEISPAGRLTDRFTPQCTGQVILGGGNGGGGYIEAFPDFPVRPDELRTKPMNHKKVIKWYKSRSGLGGRYRVIESLDGAGPGVIRGQTRYPRTSDFANLQNTRYQYSPYLFEALLQLVGFYAAATDPSERRAMIPMQIGEMKFSRECRTGEPITLEARMRARNDASLTWDTRGLDAQGRTLMQVSGLQMQWVSD
jgi:malonyl CoA-acyl carrier protein transacylase